MRTGSSIYATAADLALLGLKSEHLSIVEADNPGATAQALKSASAKARGYLGARYVMPLTAWDEDLVEAVCSIAAWLLLTGIIGAGIVGYGPDQSKLADDPHKAAFDRAIKWLTTIREREAELGWDGSGNAPTERNEVGGVIGAPEVLCDDPVGW